MYGRQILTLHEVKFVLNTREIQEKQVHLEGGTSEVLTAKGKTDKKKKLGKQKNKTKNLKCFQCHKKDQIQIIKKPKERCYSGGRERI